jgi:predicted small secreted protein
MNAYLKKNVVMVVCAFVMVFVLTGCGNALTGAGQAMQSTGRAVSELGNAAACLLDGMGEDCKVMGEKSKGYRPPETRKTQRVASTSVFERALMIQYDARAKVEKETATVARY